MVNLSTDNDRQVRKRFFIIPITVLGLIFFWWLSPGKTSARQTRALPVTGRITVSKPPFVPPIEVPKPSPDQKWLKSFKVKYGDTFHQILVSLNLKTEQINTINAQLAQVMNPKDFQVGKVYNVLYDQEFHPLVLTYESDPLKPLVIDLQELSVKYVEKQIHLSRKFLSARISSSLAASVIDAGAPEDLADKILSVLAWRIDFKQLVAGDHYKVIYQEQSVDGEVIGTDNILALHFYHDGQWYYGYGFETNQGFGYYDENGHNLSHAPLQFDRITSLYAQKRFHPVRRRWRAHYGMDFEAETGTTVEAIQDGVVTRARYGRANGNNVKIKHSEDLTTQYLHLSKIDSGLVVGQKIKRGQKIGEVGSTGLSSGPHLCLRVWYKDRQRDPLDFDFPRRADVPEELMEDFKETLQNYQSQLSNKLL